MKFFKNLLIAITAIAAMSATAAFAANDFALDAYDATNNQISVASSDLATLTEVFGDQVTVVVVPEGTTNVEEGNIYYINQDEKGNASAMLVNMGMKDLDTTKTNYEVWIGGSNGTIKKASFSTSTGNSRIKGDVVGTELGVINADDIIAVLQLSLNVGTWTDEEKTAADVVGTEVGVINADDIIAVLQKSLGLNVQFKD